MIRKNEALEARLRLTGTDGEYINDPSFTAGEVQIWADSELDGNDDPVWNNVTNLPQQIGDSEYFLLTLTAAETNYDWITVRLVAADLAWDSMEFAVSTYVEEGATEAKQDEIKALLAAGATVRVPLSEDGETMNLILGDYYSDQVMLWTVDIDYQTDFTGVLTITDRFDKSIVHKRVPVSVLSATQIATPFTAEFDSDIGLCGSPQIAHLRFALTMIEDIGSGEFNETTPQLGDCFVKARGTTSA